LNKNVQMTTCQFPRILLVCAVALCLPLLHLCPVQSISASEPADRPSALDFAGSQSHSGFDCPEGFVLEEVADDKWVHDAFSMTTDSRGNVVVSGPGYIRTLTDLDSSGRFTRAIDLKATINQGAHGLWCEVGKYFFVADGGLWVVSDANADCVADGPRQKMLDLPTGGEHDTHAIRRGPDGWWYMIVGNFASTIGKLRNDPDSPVSQPRAGTLWRISPDFSKRGVWAHGLRNAYDFDFLADGSIVTYDSDEERELTLPWYRQTRVVVLSAGSDAGWLNNAWADLASRSTMPHTLSRLGRGSPTGVKVYDHTSFPKKYHNAIFVQDWTFGRILAIYPQPKDATDTDQVPERMMAETVVQTTGKVGFAPTDITVAPDGSLLICSGGRGTTGSLYRLRYASTGPDVIDSSNANRSEVVAPVSANEAPRVSKQSAKPSENLNSSEAIVSCLSAPSPLEAWSRAQWEPIWRRASKEARSNAISNSTSFQSAASNSSAVEHPFAYSLQRRAIQCEVDLQNRGAFASEQRVSLTEFQKLCLVSNTIQSQAITSPLKSIPPASTRQTAWWALGHLPFPAMQFNAWMQTLNSVASSQSMKNFDSTDSVPLEAIIGDPVIRAFYECIGLHRGSLPAKGLWETHRAAVSGKDTRTAETQRTVRQVQLWAASRTNANVINKSTKSEDVALDTRAFDASAGRRLFGPNCNVIDASLLDQLAHRCSKKLIAFTSPEVLEALAIMQASLGDYRFAMPAHQASPTSEVIDGYRCLYGSKMPDTIRENWARWCMIIAGSQNSESWKAIVVPEALRALAMLTPKSPAAATFCLEQITPSSHPTSDIHALITLSCCNAPRAAEQTLATSDALAGLLGKVKSLAMNTESKWASRLGEIWKRLVEKDPQLPSVFVSREKFGTSDDLFWVKLCPEQSQAIGQSRFKQALLRTPLKDWEPDVARYVWSNPKQVTSEVYEYIRKQCAGQSQPPPALAIELLSTNPSKVDYDIFLSAIESNDRSCLANAWNGLSLLPVADPDREMIAIAELWSLQNQSNLSDVKPNNNNIVKRIRMVATKAKADQVSTLENKVGGVVANKSKSDSETNAAKAVLPASDSWNDWEPYLKTVLGDKFPQSKAMADATKVPLPTDWQDRVKDIDQLVGDVDRGRLIYQASKCASCHGGENANTSNALGPSLTGVAKRFSAEDLFRAIFEPSRDISDRYRATKVLTTDGTILVGMKIYDSVEGITLQLADGSLARINQADIEEKAFSDQSLMPAGLVEANSPKELADLYAYLKSL
jgi:putative heme-binding domain-containing protein